jgi:hypothetical protein
MISPLSVKKNISDVVGSRNESIDTPLYPPLFWLDNIFKLKILNARFIFIDSLLSEAALSSCINCIVQTTK